MDSPLIFSGASGNLVRGRLSPPLPQCPVPPKGLRFGKQNEHDYLLGLDVVDRLASLHFIKISDSGDSEDIMVITWRHNEHNLTTKLQLSRGGPVKK